MHFKHLRGYQSLWSPRAKQVIPSATMHTPKKHHLALNAVVAVALGLSPARMDACTVYAPQGSSIMAANYDWTVKDGLIFTNERGFSKTAFLATPSPTIRPAIWIAKYASLTLSQWGREFPMQGINEAGLTGVVLNAPAAYPVPVASQTQITEMQWLQYQLDRYSTVNEVVSHVQDMGIQKLNAALHFFFCDRTKNCGLIEFANGRATVHIGSEFELRAVTNSTYDSSVNAWETFLRNQTPESILPSGYDSLHRVVRAKWYERHSDYSDAQALANLRELAGIGWTNWNSVFHTDSKKLVISVTGSKTTYEIRRDDFAFDCRSPAKMKLITGAAVSDWSQYDARISAEQLARAAKPVAGFSAELQKRMIDYAAQRQCALSSPRRH